MACTNLNIHADRPVSLPHYNEYAGCIITVGKNGRNLCTPAQRDSCVTLLLYQLFLMICLDTILNTFSRCFIIITRKNVLFRDGPRKCFWPKHEGWSSDPYHPCKRLGGGTVCLYSVLWGVCFLIFFFSVW